MTTLAVAAVVPAVWLAVQLHVERCHSRARIIAVVNSRCPPTRWSSWRPAGTRLPAASRPMLALVALWAVGAVVQAGGVL